MKKKGFTLIELIVVIAIIGVLAAILVPAMMGYVKKSKITSANAAAKSIYTGAQSAITDLNAEDEVMTSFTGNVDIKGGLVTEASGATDAAKKFTYRVYVYFSDITKLEEATVTFTTNHEVKAVAVEDKNHYFGTHPKQMTVDKYDSTADFAAALTYAAS